MNKKLKIRLLISMAILLIGLITSIFIHRLISKGEQLDGTPSVLRYSFLWNEKISRIIWSSKRNSPTSEKPPAGKKPRVNGMIGLKSPLDPNLEIEVVTPEKKFKLPVSTFKLMPKVLHSTLFRCIEGWSEDVSYAGAKFSDFMQTYDLGKKKDGSFYQYVGLETPDGQYYVSIDMESMLHEQTVLAYEMNEHELSLDNGYPLRLIIPIKYGIKSLKRIGRITFSDLRPKDFWAERGYDWYSGF